MKPTPDHGKDAERIDLADAELVAAGEELLFRASMLGNAMRRWVHDLALESGAAASSDNLPLHHCEGSSPVPTE